MVILAVHVFPVLVSMPARQPLRSSRQSIGLEPPKVWAKKPRILVQTQARFEQPVVGPYAHPKVMEVAATRPLCLTERRATASQHYYVIGIIL